MDGAEKWSIAFAIDQLLPENVNQTEKKLRDKVRYATTTAKKNKLVLNADGTVNRSEFLRWADNNGRGFNIPLELRPFIPNTKRNHQVETLEDTIVFLDVGGGFVTPTSLKQAIAMLHERDNENMQLQVELQKAQVKIAKLQHENDALQQTADAFQKYREGRKAAADEANKVKRKRHESANQEVEALRESGYTEQEAVAKVRRNLQLNDPRACYGDIGRSIKRSRKNTTR